MTRARNNQLYRVDLSIASPSEIERTARQLTALREGFLTTGLLASHAPRPIILESWQRCRAMQVDPARRWAPLAVAREVQLQELREANELLVRAASGAMSHLTDFLAGSGYVVVLSDANGCLLDVFGDPAIRRRLAHIDFVPGGHWSEMAAGTNAIGTALADGHIVQLMAAEHFCAGWTDLTCTAAPIRHPFTRAIIGILDVTGDYRLIRSFLTSLLGAAALEIEQNLRTLLAAPRSAADQLKLSIVTASLPGSASSRDRWGKHDTPQGLHLDGGLPTVDDIRSRLNRQERRARDAELLAEAAGAISASLDLHVTLERVAEEAAHLLRLESAFAGLFDETGKVASLHVWPRQDPARPETLRILEVRLGQAEALSLVQERGEPVIIDEALDSSLLPPVLIERMGIRSMALLPLATARGVIGFIAAPRCIPYHWAVDDVRLGLALAAQAATAIENARLFNTLQQHNRRVEALNAVAQLLSMFPDPSRHLDLILARIADIMDLDVGMVLLLDQSSGLPTPLAHYGLRKAAEAPPNMEAIPAINGRGTAQELGNSRCPRPLCEVAGQVVATGQPLQIRSVEHNGLIVREALHALGFCDLLAVPLATSGTILGILLMGNSSPRALPEEDLALLTTIGQQLGMALRNAELMRSASEMEALRQADRLKSEFLAAVSHDLRSPLTAIRASVEGLLDQGTAQTVPGQEHLLNNVANQASRLARLVDQLLDLSRIEAGALPLDREWIDIPALIADAIAKFEGLAGGLGMPAGRCIMVPEAVARTDDMSGSCPVEQDFPADLPLLYVDPDRLVQVLWNLLENACKYSPPGAPIRVEAWRNGAEVVIGVADRGSGIPAADRERIFQRFYRLDRDRRAHAQGSGLGLAICRGIVEAHGGRIWVEDRPGGGSTFRVALPLPATDLTDIETLLIEQDPTASPATEALPSTRDMPALASLSFSQ
jgi:signal transduction histidine kinase